MLDGNPRHTETDSTRRSGLSPRANDRRSRWSAARVLSSALAALALFAAACAHAPVGDIEPEVGVASYYSRNLDGTKTANGGRYDMHAMTCAHRRHPFGAWLRITDLTTGRSVEVQVNDRGPFSRGRVVDLSYAAARSLGILDRGIARVQVERVR